MGCARGPHTKGDRDEPRRTAAGGRRAGGGLPVTRSAVSQHLKVLKDVGLVAEEPVGTRRVYRLNPAGVEALRDQLDTFWNRALAGYRDVTEQATKEKP